MVLFSFKGNESLQCLVKLQMAKMHSNDSINRSYTHIGQFSTQSITHKKTSISIKWRIYTCMLPCKRQKCSLTMIEISKWTCGIQWVPFYCVGRNEKKKSSTNIIKCNNLIGRIYRCNVISYSLRWKLFRWVSVYVTIIIITAFACV